MKKILYVLSVFLWCSCFAGCGEQDNTKQKNTQQGEYMDVQADSDTIFGQNNYYVAGTQFYQGEPVQIIINVSDRRADMVNICLCKEDGSTIVLLEDMPRDYSYGNLFLDTDGNLYHWSIGANSIKKLDASGKVLYSTSLTDIGGASHIVDMCSLAGGRVLITYMEGDIFSHYTLAEIDQATGKISKINTVKLDGLGHVAAGEDGLLYMDGKGVYVIDMENGSKTSVISFVGTSYQLQDEKKIKDFCVLEDGSVKILRYERDSNTGVDTYTSEVLQAEAKATEKVVLTMRCCYFSGVDYGVNGWLKNQIALFNQQSDSFMVVLDECQEGVEKEDFSRQTSIEIAAGKGPDLIYGDVLGEYVYGAIQKGALVDFVPYMDASGIKEEDYFPAAFDCWKENGGIYSVTLTVFLESYRIRQEVVGGYNVPDVETLVDALLAWQEDAVLLKRFSAQDVLEYLLQGSEDIWGMVDWEGGTCDFSGEFFAKILETAKRYGYDERKNYPEVMESRAVDVMGFDTAADREAEGMAGAGVMFDDGYHALLLNSLPGYSWNMLAVNANSAHIEGAWEFIRFLLDEKAQVQLQPDDGHIYTANPVNRKAFEVCTEKRVADYTLRKMDGYAYFSWDGQGDPVQKYPRSYKDLTEEKLAEYRKFVESARSLPIRTVPILDIIYEEAEYYFNGTKGIEEVSAIIRNRVQLYMDENS